MAWLRIRLTERQQRVGNEERSVHRCIAGVHRRCRAPSWEPRAGQAGTAICLEMSRFPAFRLPARPEIPLVCVPFTTFMVTGMAR